MIAFEINGERITKLYLDGKVSKLYGELALGVIELIKKLDLRELDGSQKKASKSVLEFGQFLCFIATETPRKVDGRSDDHDKSDKSDGSAESP